jgi:hypothetical protein
MPKRALKIPARRDGRRARWMLEISADVGRRVRRAATTSKGRRRSKRRKKTTRIIQAPATSLTDAMDVAPAGPPAVPRASRVTVQEMVVIGSVAAMVVALVAFAKYPTPPVESVAANSPRVVRTPRVVGAVDSDSRPDTAYVSKAVADVSKAILEKPMPAPRVTTRRAFEAGAPAPSPVVLTTRDAQPSAPVKTTAAPSNASPAPAAAMSDTPSELVTITGCLEMSVDEDQFRLTETEGAAAPKARNWRSGFLKRGAAPVELVEVTDPLGLKTEVGRRVVATGRLNGRALHLQSLQPAGAACD